jgi:glyoxylase-like metal-dependent hydrolase (beta-lactamase superfamily II)
MSEKDKGMLPPALNAAKFHWVKDGDVIDLGGGRSLEVIEVPGHTDGSLFYLDRAGKALAVGDAIGSGSYVWKFTGKQSLAEYRDTMKRLESRLAGFDSLTFLVGHYYQMKTPLVGTAGKRMITDMRILCEIIISGEIKGTPASVNLGPRKMSVLTASYGLAGIWYDPDNIQPAK